MVTGADGRDKSQAFGNARTPPTPHPPKLQGKLLSFSLDFEIKASFIFRPKYFGGSSIILFFLTQQNLILKDHKWAKKGSKCAVTVSKFVDV